jgi:hypothetical protein
MTCASCNCKVCSLQVAPLCGTTVGNNTLCSDLHAFNALRCWCRYTEISDYDFNNPGVNMTVRTHSTCATRPVACTVSCITCCCLLCCAMWHAAVCCHAPCCVLLLAVIYIHSSSRNCVVCMFRPHLVATLRFGAYTGHFTQVVWKATTRLGCWAAACPNLFEDWAMGGGRSVSVHALCTEQL